MHFPNSFLRRRLRDQRGEGRDREMRYYSIVPSGRRL
jgi:hypothetical protein